MLLSICDKLSNTSSGCGGYISYVICCFNTVILLIFGVFLLLKLLITAITSLFIINEDWLKSFRFDKAFKRSIFSYLDSNTRHGTMKHYFLYFNMAYGLFFLRSLGDIVGLLLSSDCGNNETPAWEPFILGLLKAIPDTLYFFNIIFMIYFYGIKIEILSIKGDPSVISASERQAFLEMIIRRSIVFTIFYFVLALVKLSAYVESLALFAIEDNSLFDWSVTCIQYGFVSILTLNRLSYIGFDEKMAQKRISKKNKDFLLLSFTKHFEDYTPSNKDLQSIIKSLNTNEANLPLAFQRDIEAKCQKSLGIFNEKSNSENNELYQTHVRVPMENYLAGRAWLILSLINSLMNCFVSFGVVIAHTINSGSTWLSVLLIISSSLYANETILQGVLCNYIIGNKEHFGDHLGNESLLSEDSRYSIKIIFDGEGSHSRGENSVEISHGRDLDH